MTVCIAKILEAAKILNREKKQIEGTQETSKLSCPASRNWPKSCASPSLAGEVPGGYFAQCTRQQKSPSNPSQKKQNPHSVR